MSAARSAAQDRGHPFVATGTAPGTPAPTAASVYHVRKEDLRPGSALDVDPPFPAFDVVHRQAYERLAEEVARLREQVNSGRLGRERAEGLPEGTLPRV